MSRVLQTDKWLSLQPHNSVHKCFNLIPNRRTPSYIRKQSYRCIHSERKKNKSTRGLPLPEFHFHGKCDDPHTPVMLCISVKHYMLQTRYEALLLFLPGFCMDHIGHVLWHDLHQWNSTFHTGRFHTGVLRT